MEMACIAVNWKWFQAFCQSDDQQSLYEVEEAEERLEWLCEEMSWSVFQLICDTVHQKECAAEIAALGVELASLSIVFPRDDRWPAVPEAVVQEVSLCLAPADVTASQTAGKTMVDARWVDVVARHVPEIELPNASEPIQDICVRLSEALTTARDAGHGMLICAL